jgi:diadenosine tetraphosphate (Ap4A) HIT family hydrolase
MSFTLHPQLAADTAHIGNLDVCRVLLMNNQHFHWLILVPMRENIRELHELDDGDYFKVMEEVRTVSKKLATHTKADKMNVAALGNVVPQLHIHIIARFMDDPAWPKPVWGNAEFLHYNETALRQKTSEIAGLLGTIRTIK